MGLASRDAKSGSPTNRPVFSAELDAHPEVAAWLAGLDDETRASLSSPLSRSKKQRRLNPKALDNIIRSDAPPPSSGLDGDAREALRPSIVRAMASSLPQWQMKAAALWLAGLSRPDIAKELGISLASVRAALDGQPHHRDGKKEPGAIRKIATALSDDKEFLEMAKKKLDEKDKPDPILSWFKGIAHKPELFAPLAFLYLLTKLVDARKEVRVNDVLPHVPRACVTPFISMLRAHGFAGCDGMTIKIHRLPVEAEEA